MTTTDTDTIKKGTSARMARPGAVLFAVGVFLLLGGATAWACAPVTTARARPAQGAAGSTVTISGAGFPAADGPVSIYFGGRSGALLATATVDSAGNFSQVVAIPESAPGSYFLQAVQGPSRSANFPFEITGASAPAPTPPPAPSPTPAPDPAPAPDPGTSPQPPPVATQPIAPQPVEMAPQPEQQPVAPQPAQPQQPPVAQEPVVLQPQPPAGPQPVAQPPGGQQPVAQQPVASAPVVLQPVLVQPVIQRLAAVGIPSPSATGPQAAATPGSATSAQPAATPTPATASTPSAGAGATDGAGAEAPTAGQETAVEPAPLTDGSGTFREVDAGGPSPWVLIPLAMLGLGVSVFGLAAFAHEVRRTRARARN